jgi:hypothetical protein
MGGAALAGRFEILPDDFGCSRRSIFPILVAFFVIAERATLRFFVGGSSGVARRGGGVGALMNVAGGEGEPRGGVTGVGEPVSTMETEAVGGFA